VGSLSLTHGDRVVTLETPYAAALIREPGRLDTGTVTPAEVRAAFGAALEALPPRPASFTLNFLEDSDELTPESRAVLAQVLGEIAGRPVAEASVVGHTDRVGSAAYNDALSLERAKRVREALVGLGVPPERIAVAGRGEREPLVSTEEERPEPGNRRVEITIY
jgi:outer membrane protein OmpA-like peptidoglycan-associated protein